MALVKCPDCKKRISNTAPSCPHCGHVLTTEERKVKSSLTKKIFKILLGIVAIIVAFGLIKGMTQSPEEKARIKAGNAEYIHSPGIAQFFWKHLLYLFVSAVYEVVADQRNRSRPY